MSPIESGIEVGPVRADVAASRLVAGKRRASDETCERIGVVRKPLEPGGTAHEPGELPERLARALIDSLKRSRLGARRLAGGARLAERRERRPAAEHETFAE